MYNDAWKEREKCVTAESYHRKQSNMSSLILVSFFKGHTSISWIQISMEKAYQSNFAQPSTQPNRNETDYVKGYFSPLPMTYERVLRNHSIVLPVYTERLTPELLLALGLK